MSGSPDLTLTFSSSSSTSQVTNSDPLNFCFEWLSPQKNDIHSKSRSQCTLLEYLRGARLFLKNNSIASDSIGKNYLEILKVITALDIMQAPPLRKALAELWVTYLGAGRGFTIIITAASWLMEQTRRIEGPGQASVFIECLSRVFVEHAKSLMALSVEACAILLRFPQQAGSNSAIAVASRGLVELTSYDASSLRPNFNTVIERVAVPLIETPSTRLRVNGLWLLYNILKSGHVPLSLLMRRRVKSVVEKLFHHEHDQVRKAAYMLMSTLLWYSGDGKKKLSGKVVESLGKLSMQLENISISNGIILALILHLATIEEILQFFSNLLNEQTRRISLVPDKKPLNWKIESSQLELLLPELESLPENFTSQLATHLLSTSRKDLKPVIQNWYCRLLIQGRTLTPQLESMIINNLNHADPEVAAAACSWIVRRDPASKSLLIAQFFAEIKGDLVLKSSPHENHPISLDKINVVGACLARLIKESIEDDVFPETLYRNREIEDLIWEWAFNVLVTRQVDFEMAAWGILGSLCHSNEQYQSVEALLGDRAPSEDLILDRGPLIGLNYLDKLGHLPSLGQFLTIQWRKFSSLMDGEADFSSNCHSQTILLLCQVTLCALNAGINIGDAAGNGSAKALCHITLPPELVTTLQQLFYRHVKTCSMSSLRYYLSQFKIFSTDAACRLVIFETLLDLMDLLEARKMGGDDQKFVMDVLKDIFFPFICHTHPNRQRKGAEGLGKLVRLVSTREFRDVVLQELVDRALNEQDERYRRGYILGIGIVYASIPERGSKLDLSLVMGLLSSLAKDQRSLIVQMAAIEAIAQVLEARSNAEGSFFIEDTVFLLWQIFTTDLNLILNDRALEDDLKIPLMKAILALMDALGPECSSNGSLARITRIMAMEEAHYSHQHGEEEDQLGIGIELLTRMVLVLHQVDNLTEILDLIKKAMCRQTKKVIQKSLTLLKWLIQYMTEAVAVQVDIELIYLLLRLELKSGDGLEGGEDELRFCFNSFLARDPKSLMDFINKGHFHSIRPSNVNVNTMVGPPSNEYSLLSGINDIPYKLSTQSFTSSIMDQLLELTSGWLEYQAPFIQNISPFATVVDGIVRLSLNLLMSEITLQSTKLASIRLVVTMLHTKVVDWKDPLDERCWLLDTFVSQLATIFSTACSSTDPLVAAYGFDGLFGVAFGSASHLQLGKHSKVTTLLNRAVEILYNRTNIELRNSQPWSLEMYCHTLIMGSLVDLNPSIISTMSTITKLDESQKNLIKMATSRQLNGHDKLALAIINLIPRLITPKLFNEKMGKDQRREQKEKVEELILGAGWLILKAQPNSSYYLQAILNLPERNIVLELKQALLNRLIETELSSKVAHLILEAHTKVKSIMKEIPYSILIRKAVAKLVMDSSKISSPSLASRIQVLGTLIKDNPQFVPCLIYALEQYYPTTITSNDDLLSIVKVAKSLCNLLDDTTIIDLLSLLIIKVSKDGLFGKVLPALGPFIKEIPLDIETQTGLLFRDYFALDALKAKLAWRELIKFKAYNSLGLITSDLFVKQLEPTEYQLVLGPIQLSAGPERDCFIALSTK